MCLISWQLVSEMKISAESGGMHLHLRKLMSARSAYGGGYGPWRLAAASMKWRRLQAAQCAAAVQQSE